MGRKEEGFVNEKKAVVKEWEQKYQDLKAELTAALGLKDTEMERRELVLKAESSSAIASALRDMENMKAGFDHEKQTLVEDWSLKCKQLTEKLEKTLTGEQVTADEANEKLNKSEADLMECKMQIQQMQLTM